MKLKYSFLFYVLFVSINKSDFIFSTAVFLKSMLNVIERKYGMQLLYQETKKNEDNCMKRKNIFHPHVKILPKNVDDSVKLREPSFEELTKTYGTNRRCAIHPFPWNNVVGECSDTNMLIHTKPDIDS